MTTTELGTEIKEFKKKLMRYLTDHDLWGISRHFLDFTITSDEIWVEFEDTSKVVRIKIFDFDKYYEVRSDV